jgi:hypothetical protein
MDMDQSAVFLAGSILTALGFIVAVAAIVVINNILHKYWKPVRIWAPWESHTVHPHRFITQEELDKLERIAPVLNEEPNAKSIEERHEISQTKQK